MRALFGLVLVIGMGLAGFAVYMVKGYFNDQQLALQQVKQQAAAVVPTVDVYAVNKPLAFGERVTPDDVVVIKHTQEFLPEGAFTELEALFPDGIEPYRTVLRPMEPNEPVTSLKVTEPALTADITNSLRRGMRAFTIRVDATTGVSGFLRPADRVDLYWTGNVGGYSENGTDANETFLIGTGIEIVAVDQSTDPNTVSTEVPQTVTVQVSPQDVARLAQAQSTGNISLALVGKDATLDIVADGESAITLPERRAAPVVVAAEPTPVEEACYTTVRRGTEMVQIPITCTN